MEKKAIADVVRARIAVDKTVAVEEENIKDVRVIAEAKRDQGGARSSPPRPTPQETLVKDIKAAEASERGRPSMPRAKKTITLAEAELETADKQARAKIRLAEGIAGRGGRRGPGQACG